MKWIGQHIFDLIARFRSSVIMESLPTETPVSFLGVNASNEVVKGAITATKTTAGIVELATTAETTTGTSETLAVTPDGLKDGYQGSTNVTTLGTVATGVWNGDALTQAYIGAEAINESKLQVSNAPVNGYMLTAQSGNTGGLTWAVIPTDTNTNIANTDLTATGDRTLNLDSNDLIFSNVADLTLNAQSTIINGQFAAIKSGADAPDFRIYEDSDHGTNYGKFTLGALGANRTYTLPDATGTIALTSNIPTGNSIIDWTGASAGTIHSTNIPTLNQNTTGSAATLTTARTIGGVSFNGSASIDLPGVSETGDQDTSGNAATATALQTARDIGGISFNGTASINLPGVNTSGNQNTSGNAATATALTTGNKDITGTLNVKTTTATANPFISFSQTTTRRAFIQLADNNAGFENHLRIASEYGPVSIAAAGTAGSDTDTVFFMVEPTGIFKFGAVDSDAVLTTDGNMTFRIDADNDETSQKFSFQNNASTEIASLNESGVLDLEGIVRPDITYIKILHSDFIADDVGRPAQIDDTGSDRWLKSHSTAKLYASVEIPLGFKATHVDVYGSGTSAVTVYEADVDSKTVTSKGTGNIGTQINITDVTADATNYLLIELAQTSSEEVYGGKITIAKE